MKTFKEFAIEEGAKFKKVKKFVPDKAGNLKKVIKKECQDANGSKAPGYKIVDGKMCKKMTPAEQAAKRKTMKKVQKTKKKHATKNAKRAEKIKIKKIAKGIIKEPVDLDEGFRDYILKTNEKIDGTDYLMNRGTYKDKRGNDVNIIDIIKKVGSKDMIKLKSNEKEYTIALDVFKAQYTQINESKEKIYGVVFYSDEDEEHDIGTVYFRAKNNDEAIKLAQKAKIFKIGSYLSIDSYETDGEKSILDAGYNIEN